MNKKNFHSVAGTLFRMICFIYVSLSFKSSHRLTEKIQTNRWVKNGNPTGENPKNYT